MTKTSATKNTITQAPKTIKKAPIQKTVAKTPTLRKPQKITYPRLFNAVEDLAKEAGLTSGSTMSDLYSALEAAIVKDARGR